MSLDRFGQTSLKPLSSRGENMKKLIIALVVAAALVTGALNFHFILIDSKIKILKKADLTFEDTFVDARGAKKLKLFSKPALVKAGIKDLLKD
jgi:hypothetical protein